MDAPGGGIDEPRERVHVRRLELRQLPVLDQQPRHFMSHRRELFQHLIVGRRTGLGLLEDRELVLLEQHVPQLRSGVDVEVGACGLVDRPLESGELAGKRSGDLAQAPDVDANATRFHVHQDGDEGQLDCLEEPR